MKMTQSVDMGWGELTDDIQHAGIDLNEEIRKKINSKAEETSELEAFRNKDFYLVPIIRTHKVTGKMEWPPIIVTRHSCPTPVYNQHVFVYHHQNKIVEWLWTIPAQYKHLYYLKHAREFLVDLDENQRSQAQICLDFESGKLLNAVKRANKESDNPWQRVLRPKTQEEIII